MKRPTPSLSWWENDKLLESSSTTLTTSPTKETVTSRLKIVNLGREHLKYVYRCEARNNNMSLPIVTEFRLSINCKYFVNSLIFSTVIYKKIISCDFQFLQLNFCILLPIYTKMNWFCFIKKNTFVDLYHKNWNK